MPCIAGRGTGPRRAKQEDHNQESYLVGSMLGLLALLLAFSFSMALDRYEERRHLVIQEANAIGTAYLRTQLLDEPHRARLSGLLVDYTDNRIALGDGSHAASWIASWRDQRQAADRHLGGSYGCSRIRHRARHHDGRC